jgi:hypothetical protein
MISEIEVGIAGIKDQNHHYNYISNGKAYLKPMNLFLGRKSADQTEMFEWINKFHITTEKKALETTADDELPFSKIEETPGNRFVGFKGGKAFYLTPEMIASAPAWIKKIVDMHNEWYNSSAPLKPTNLTNELDVMGLAASSIVSNLFDERGVLRKNFGNHKLAVQGSRNRQRDVVDKAFNRYKFNKKQLKGLEWRREVYKNPNNIIAIAEYHKGQFERFIKFYNGVYDEARIIAKTRETSSGEVDPMYKRYKKYNDLYYKWFDIVVQQSINSAKAEGREHYFLPTAEAMAAVEGNVAARKIYVTPSEAISEKEKPFDSVLRYVSSLDTPEKANEIRPYMEDLRSKGYSFDANSSGEQIADALMRDTDFYYESDAFHKWADNNKQPSVEPTGPFYNALAKFAKKNNIKLTTETPQWSEAPLIRVDLSKYTPKPIDRFSKLDKKPQPAKEPNSNLAKFKKEISLSSKQISSSKMAAINSKVKMANGKLGTSYYVKFTPVGESDLRTWEIIDYAPKNDTAFFKDGSLAELSNQAREKYPLNNDTNNQTQAIETLTEMARGLSNQLGTNFQFVTAKQAREITNGEWNGEPGFFIGDTSYFVGDKLRPDIILHEFSHPLIRSIAISNSKLFNSLYDKMASTPEGRTIIDQVTRDYTNLKPGSDMFKEECLVRSLVEAANLDASPIKEPVGFAKFIKDLLYAIKQLLRKVFGQKVDVAKLGPNTTLKEIADMLMAGKNFKVETDAVSENDTIAYMKDMTGFISDIQKLSKPELMALTTRIFDISTKHIDIVLNNKNYAEMLHILADEYDRGDLQEMRKNLSKYANTMSTRLNEIKDEIQFNKNHAAAMVDTMFRLEGMSEKILAHMEDLATDPNNKDNLQKAFYYGELIRAWSQFIDEAKVALDEQKVPSNSPMSQLVSSIDRTFEKARAVGQTMSAHGVRDVLFDELMPIAKTIDHRYNTIIADLEKRNSPPAIIDKWYKEYHGLSKKDQTRLEELEKADKAGRLTTALKKEYDTLLRQSYEGAKLTKEKLEKSLKGELGDANAFNSFFEGYMYNNDPIIGGFALYVKNNMTDVLTNAQAKFNTFATDMKPLLEAAGYNPSNVADLASKITHLQKVGSRDKDGNFVEKQVFSFLSPHQNYRFAIDEHRHAIDTTEKAFALTGSKEDQNKMIDAISALKTLQRNYFHQEYDPRYYELEGILERDDIGKKAAYLRDNIFERMREITRTLETQGDEMKFADQIDLLWAEYRQLNSIYDLNGKLKIGEPLAIAQRLREHKDASREFHEWKERKGVFQNSLKAYEQELVNSNIPADSDAFNLARKEWINRNTRTVVKQSFYERRKLVMDRIAAIMSKIPDSVRKDIDIGPMYQAITDILYTSRDDDNQPNGQDMSPESIAEVKDLQEKIIKAQKAFAGLNGLNEAESQELSSYFDIIKRGERKITIEEKTRMDELLSKKNMFGLNGLTKTELFKLFADLDTMQRKEATEYYVDIMNNWLDKLDTTNLKDRNKVGLINKVTAGIVLEDNVIEDLLSQNQDFAKWFRENHIQKMKWNPITKVKERVWERLATWNVTRPTDPSDYETTTILDNDGNVVEELQGLPTTKYYIRRVKNEYRTKKVVGQTTDNKGQWLPRLDVKDSPYLNPEYFRLKKEDPKLFAVLEKMAEHHLKNQEGLGYRSRLYLDVPRFRKNTLEMVQAQQLKRTLKGAVAGRLPLLTLLVQRMKLFWQRGKDATEQGLNPHDDFMLVRADMFDNEVSSIPIAGLYDIDHTDVSLDLTHSMMRYMLSAERQKKLIEINPVARALQSVVNNDKNQVKRLDAANRFNFINRGIITYMNKKGMNVRRSAVNNFIEREFEGQTNTGMLTDVPWLNNTASLIFKRASFGFFALNIPSALKNTLGAKFQGMIEAAGGKYMNLKDFAKGELWAFNTMGQVSFEIYKKGPKSLNIQLMEVFDALQGRFEEKFGESMSRTLASDTANLSWLYNFRKWTEHQATLQSFAGMMHHQKVMQNGVEIDYINAWETRDGKIQLKEGIDPSWGITYDKEGNMHVGAEFKMMKNRVHQVINSLNGAYASFDQPEAQRYLAFRFVSFLRRYFTTMAVNRWGFAGGFGKARGRMNPGLGDINEGYYITVMKTLSRMVTTDIKYMGYMTKDEKIAWIKTTTELFALIALSMILAPMFGWDPDDPDKYEKLRKKSGAMPFFGLVPEDPENPFDGAGFLENHMLNLAMQVRSENEQFVPWPNFGLDDYTSMLDLKSLATGPTLKAYKQMFTVGLDEVTGDPSAFYKRSIGPYDWQQEGGSKFLNYLFKSFGLTGSSIDPGTAIKNSQGIIIRGK